MPFLAKLLTSTIMGISSFLGFHHATTVEVKTSIEASTTQPHANIPATVPTATPISVSKPTPIAKAASVQSETPIVVAAPPVVQVPVATPAPSIPTISATLVSQSGTYSAGYLAMTSSGMNAGVSSHDDFTLVVNIQGGNQALYIQQLLAEMRQMDLIIL